MNWIDGCPSIVVLPSHKLVFVPQTLLWFLTRRLHDAVTIDFDFESNNGRKSVLGAVVDPGFS